ncbi:hypothetical protein Sjap_018913 [Stephania japonica]|uniref:Uncharacterized protein n=1 Tax=Stephania japonica TaxID=461633 RepID=A0AAP0I947_9MAGN
MWDNVSRGGGVGHPWLLYILNRKCLSLLLITSSRWNGRRCGGRRRPCLGHRSLHKSQKSPICGGDAMAVLICRSGCGGAAVIGDDFRWFIGVPTVPNHPSPRSKRAGYGGFVFGYGREWWFCDLARVSPASLCRSGSLPMSDNTSDIVTFSPETTRRGGTVIDAMTWGTVGDLTMSIMESHSPGASISMMMSRNGGDMRELFILRRVVVKAT